MTPPLDKARGLMELANLAVQGDLSMGSRFSRENEDSFPGQGIDVPSYESSDGIHSDAIQVWGDNCERLAAFIAAACNFARTDLHALVAEVERLRSLLGEASEYLHDVPKESADGDSCASLARRIRAELSTAPAKESQS